MFKLLDTPFGLNLEVLDINNFFNNKVSKKLTFWCNSKLSLIGCLS
jgi:hypothetical protein